MTASQRLALNTVATYGRSIFNIGLGLFGSRWVLNALGQTDFGLFAIVGSIIISMTFLNATMAGSVARYYAYSIGQGQQREVTNWFNVALSMHLCLAAAIVLIGLPIGEYVIRHILTMPQDRISTCVWVFRISLISAFVSMISVPFVAMFTAHQKITETAFWGIVQTILSFTLAFSLTQITGNLLLIYTIAMTAIIVSVQMMMVFRAFVVFKECRLSFPYWFNRKRFKNIFSFAGWTLIGELGGTVRNQGSAILLNIYFGPGMNSAFGIAKQVSAGADQLAMAMLAAFSPEITASEGRGDRLRMLSLSNHANKFGSILILIFAMPLMVEMEYVLKIWLKVPPPHTAMFCRLMLATFLIDRLTGGFLLAVKAHGKIAAYQATIGGIIMMTLPLAWLFFTQGFPPTSLGVAYIITIVACTLSRVFWVRHLLGVSFYLWLKTAVFPNFLIGAISAGISYFLVFCIHESFIRLLYVLCISMAASALACWFWVFDAAECEFILKNCRKILAKLNL